MVRKPLTAKDIVINILLIIAVWLCIRILSYKSAEFQLPSRIEKVNALMTGDASKFNTTLATLFQTKKIVQVEKEGKRVEELQVELNVDCIDKVNMLFNISTDIIAKNKLQNVDTVIPSIHQNPQATTKMDNAYIQVAGAGAGDVDMTSALNTSSVIQNHSKSDVVDADDITFKETYPGLLARIGETLEISKDVKTQWTEFYSMADELVKAELYPKNIMLHKEVFHTWYGPLMHVFNKFYYSSDFLAKTLRHAAVHKLTSFSKKVLTTVKNKEKKTEPFINFQKWARECKNVDFPDRQVIESLNSDMFKTGSFWMTALLVVCFIVFLSLSINYNKDIQGVAFSVATLILAVAVARFVFYLVDVIGDQIYYAQVRTRIFRRLLEKVINQVDAQGVLNIHDIADPGTKIGIMGLVPKFIKDIVFKKYSKQFEIAMESFFENKMSPLVTAGVKQVIDQYTTTGFVSFMPGDEIKNPPIQDRIQILVSGVSQKDIVDYFFVNENDYVEKLQKVSRNPPDPNLYHLNIYECTTAFAINMYLFRCVLRKLQGTKMKNADLAILTYCISFVINIAVIIVFYVIKLAVLYVGKGLNKVIKSQTLHPDYYQLVNLAAALGGEKPFKHVWTIILKYTPVLVLPFLCGVAMAVFLTQMLVLVRKAQKVATSDEYQKTFFLELAVACSVFFAITFYSMECLMEKITVLRYYILFGALSLGIVLLNKIISMILKKYRGDDDE
jgi:hypothetical protein